MIDTCSLLTKPTSTKLTLRQMRLQHMLTKTALVFILQTWTTSTHCATKTRKNTDRLVSDCMILRTSLKNIKTTAISWPQSK
jgi:hypothetical protein